MLVFLLRRNYLTLAFLLNIFLEVPSFAVYLDEETEGYESHFIYVNTYNPIKLDLHGAPSVAYAHIRFLQFVEAALRKGKKEVTVITGRGNHINRGGNRGTLFSLLPLWIETFRSKKQIFSYTPIHSDGGYQLSLSPATNAVSWPGISAYVVQQEKAFFYEGESLEDQVRRRNKKLHKTKKQKRFKKHQKNFLARFKGETTTLISKQSIKLPKKYPAKCSID